MFLHVQVNLDFREGSKLEHDHRLEIVVVPANAHRHRPAVKLSTQDIAMLGEPAFLKVVLRRNLQRGDAVQRDEQISGNHVRRLKSLFEITAFA